MVTLPAGIILMLSFYFLFVSQNSIPTLALKQKASCVMVVSQLIPSLDFLFSQFASQSKISEWF